MNMNRRLLAARSDAEEDDTEHSLLMQSLELKMHGFLKDELENMLEKVGGRSSR